MSDPKSETDLPLPTGPRPDANRLAWLMSGMPKVGRTSVDLHVFDELRAELSARDAEVASLRAALTSWQTLNVECFIDGTPAPRTGCECNTCETWREGDAALAGRGPEARGEPLVTEILADEEPPTPEEVEEMNAPGEWPDAKPSPDWRGLLEKARAVAHYKPGSRMVSVDLGALEDLARELSRWP